MHNAGIHGLPGPAKTKRVKGIPTSDDLVERRFARSRLNELWVSDITEHPTREGKVFCCCVMDTFSRRIVGWSIDSVQDSQLVINALDMAISQRQTRKGGIVHADHGVQFTSWAFTDTVRTAGLMPSFGPVGDAFDNAMMESFWSSMQNELLNRKRWTTRIELSTRCSSTSKSSTTAVAGTPSSATFHPSNTSARSPKKPPDSTLRVESKRAAGQDVTYPCSRPPESAVRTMG